MAKQFLGVKAVPGKVVCGSFVVDEVHIPLVLAAGKADGPTLVIHCAQHAAEYSGTAMIGPLLAELDLAKVKGTLAIVPLCNIPTITRLRLPHAYQRQIDTLKPDEGKPRENINRCWPGKADGTWNDKLAYALSQGLFAKADAVLDYHSCRMCDPDFTSYVVSDKKGRQIALAFGFEAIDENPEEGHLPGQLHRRVPMEIGTPAVLVEMAPTNEKTRWASVVLAKRGAFNVMKHLGMLAGRPQLPPRQVVFHRDTPTAVMRASQVGFVAYYHNQVDVVKKGDLVVEVRSLRDFSVLERHVAPFDGAVGGSGPAVHHICLPDEELAVVQPDVEVIYNK